jgi:phosphatidylglycerol---prolipoprotein diacylglyceryl transferase
VAPWIPYLRVPDLPLIPQDFFGSGTPPIPITIKPFGTLVAIGVYVGAWLSVRQARRLGLNEQALVSFVFSVVVSGFVFGHVLDVVFYYPGKMLDDPLSLIRLWDGLSSFGGFTGAAIGALLWRLRYKTAILPYVDVVSSAFPVAWVFGRSGCALAHDHPGIHSDAWFAVRYPDGGRFDLGLYEMILTIPLALTFLWLRRKPRPWGFYTGAMCVAYAPSRFALDFLRAKDLASSDPRYVALTPGQWACFVLLGFGVWMSWRALSRPSLVVPRAPVASVPG